MLHQEKKLSLLPSRLPIKHKTNLLVHDPRPVPVYILPRSVSITHIIIAESQIVSKIVCSGRQTISYIRFEAPQWSMPKLHIWIKSFVPFSTIIEDPHASRRDDVEDRWIHVPVAQRPVDSRARFTKTGVGCRVSKRLRSREKCRNTVRGVGWTRTGADGQSLCSLTVCTGCVVDFVSRARPRFTQGCCTCKLSTRYTRKYTQTNRSDYITPERQQRQEN